MEGPSSLRPATADDLPSVLQIECKVQVAPWTEANFKAELEKPYSHFLVLTDDETDSKVVGYVVFWLMFDECQVLTIAVDFPYRGLGFAKQMLRTTVKEALKKNIRRVVLDVRKSNLSAIQLYQSLSFVITQVRKGFYSNGEDAYQMTLFLQEEGLQF
jgi:ribosomal-protein-alanine N-acetyltransferase